MPRRGMIGGGGGRSDCGDRGTVLLRIRCIVVRIRRIVVMTGAKAIGVAIIDAGGIGWRHHVASRRRGYTRHTRDLRGHRIATGVFE